MNIPVAAFRAQCLKLMDHVAKTGEAIVITKHGKPIARLAPISPEPESAFGYMKGLLESHGDIVAPIDEPWSALSGDEDDLYIQASAKPHSRRR